MKPGTGKEPEKVPPPAEAPMPEEFAFSAHRSDVDIVMDIAASTLASAIQLQDPFTKARILHTAAGHYELLGQVQEAIEEESAEGGPSDE